MVEELFVFFYPVVTLIMIVGYIPQTVSIIRNPEKTEGVSLSSWYLWTFSSFLTTGYALFHIADLMFIISSSVNLFFCGGITALLLFARCQYRRVIEEEAIWVEPTVKN